MLNPSVSPEETRLAALRRYHILDTPTDPAFDRLTELAARLFAVPYAAISFVDADEVHFKSCFGLSLRTIPRPDSFCDCVLSLGGVFVCEDVAQDSRFQDNFLVVRPPFLRFYAGAPLYTPDGFVIGILCLADTMPRAFPEDSRASLASLAGFVMREVELHRALHQLEAEAVAGKVTDISTAYETERRDLPPVYLRLQKAYNELEAWVGHRTAALERANRALEHEVAERERAEAALRAARAELEERITERTAALERANQELRQQVAERREAEKRLGESRQRYRSLFEQNQDAVYSFNREGRFLSANAACEALSGYRPQELLQMAFREMVAPEHLDRALGMFQKAMQGEAQHDEIAITRKDGRRVEISVTKMPILIGGEIVGVFGISRDITARREMERERERLLAEAVARADTDSLTGLANHGAFHREVHEALQVAGQSGQRVMVVLLDMDDFRFLNNAYGHVVGDAVLRQVADALRELAGRKSGATIARYGGDQFAVLLPSATQAEVDALAETLAERLDFRPPGHDSAIPLTLSAGAARFPDDGVTRQELLASADTRLRRAKTGGTGQVDQLRTAMSRSVEGFSMLDALVAAVDNKDRYTQRHSEDVLTYSLQIAEALGMDEAAQHTVAVAALLHDVGKIGVPDAILRKPGILTDAEFEAIKQHPMMGSVIVGAVPGFEGTLDAVRHHHERWDGGGYPFGLSGAEIPLLARLMAVADAFSAMTTDRPYRKGMSAAQARALLEQGAGSQWDPQCVRAFLKAARSPGNGSVPDAEMPPDDLSCQSRADCAE